MKFVTRVYPDIRCPKCNKLLARGVLDQGVMELKCPDSRCRTKVLLRASSPNLAPQDGLPNGDRHATEHSS